MGIANLRLILPLLDRRHRVLNVRVGLEIGVGVDVHAELSPIYCAESPLGTSLLPAGDVTATAASVPNQLDVAPPRSLLAPAGSGYVHGSLPIPRGHH